MTSSLEFIRISNLRSIVMSEDIEIKPITILIGKNSAGKSTFARSFPLIRQSCEAKKRAPILWFGDRADFGSFDESLRRNETGDVEIKFSFGLNISNEILIQRNRFLGREQLNRPAYKAIIGLNIVKAVNRPSLASSITIDALGFKAVITLNSRNSVDSIACGKCEWKPSVDEVTEADYKSILPRILFYRRSTKDEISKIGPYVEFRPFDAYIHKRISQSRFSEFEEFITKAIMAAPPLPRGELANFVLMRLPFARTNKKSSADKLSEMISELEDFAMISRINSFLEDFDGAIKEYYDGVKYIEPLRATAQRYYRKQELAIDEIDSRGENLAMFLDSIHGWRLDQFNSWTTENFGFSVRAKNEGGHLTIVIKENGGSSESNLADIGFGFSQILPVITQIWLSTVDYLYNTKNTTAIVIEQPELHLHPSFQAKLADVFAAAISDANRYPRFIIETHSNHIVNRLGQLINEGKLRNDQVQILIFEKGTDSISEIKVAGYNEKGYLKNWPIGFFEPEA